MSKHLSSPLLLLLFYLLNPITCMPQVETTTTTTTTTTVAAEGQQQLQHQEKEEEQPTRGAKDPLRWVWLDGASLSLEWPARFSLSINGAVTAYSLSLTHPQEPHSSATTTMFHSTTLRHQFQGLRSNVTYAGRLVALVGPHHWPYTLLNFTVTSPTLHTGLGLGQRAHPSRPRSTTADLDSITVSATLRWSPTPFLQGHAAGEMVRPTVYRLRVWDQKRLVSQVATDAGTHNQGCEAAVGGLTLDTVYKATLDAVLPDGSLGTSLTFSLDAGALHVAGGGLTTDGVSECYSGLQVRCPGSERCVSPYWICDGAPDCPDGVDEVGCDMTPCDGFRCWDDVCIPWAWRCDGHLDCKDGDDEYACPLCDQGDLRCPWGGACLQQNATCDGVADCRDGWDESAALCGSVACGAGELQCLGGSRCVPHQWLCDGVSDCPAAEDEDITFCSAFTSFRDSVVINATSDSSTCESRQTPRRVNCTEEEFRCDSRSCVLREYLCDGVRDCENGRDELPQSCSLAPTQAATTRKFRFDSEEDFNDEDQNVLSNEDEECNEQEGNLCGILGTELVSNEGDREDLTSTTESNQVHPREPFTTEKSEPVLDADNWIDDELPDVRTTVPSTTAVTSLEEPLVSIIEANMTDVGSNEIDISFFEYSDSETPDEETTETLNGVSVIVKVLVEEKEEERKEKDDDDKGGPSSTHPETGLNLSSSEENDYEESFTLEIDRLPPSGAKNVTDSTNYIEEDFRQDFNKSTVLKSDEVVEKVNVEDDRNFTHRLPPTHEQNTTMEEEQEHVRINKEYGDIEEDDSDLLLPSDDPITVQVVSTSEETTETEATVINVTLPFMSDDDDTHSTTFRTIVSDVIHGTTVSGIRGTDITSTTPRTRTQPSVEVKEAVEEGTALYPRVTNGSTVTEGQQDPHHTDITSLEFRTTTESGTTTATISITSSAPSTTATTVTTSSPIKPETLNSTPVQEATGPTEEVTTITDKTTTTSSTPLSPSSAIPTQPSTQETGQKNLTILIAIRAGLNESEVPRYTIHGADGSTYQYEIVSIVKEEAEEEKQEKEDIRNILEEEEEMTNEIRGDGSHQFLQGINISSATTFLPPSTCLLLLLLTSLLSTTVFLDSDAK